MIQRPSRMLAGAGLAALAVLVVVTAGCAVTPPAVDATQALNDVRRRGCGGRPGASAALHPDARLDRVAARLAGGRGLADALAAEHYPAARSTSIHVMRAPSGLSVERMLATQFCKTIIDEEFEAFGAARRGGETWLVLAAGFRAPVVTDMRAVATRVLELVNAARSRPRSCGNRKFAATTPLTLDAALGRAAEGHARDMARESRMSHVGSDGSTVGDRVTRAGYPWRTVAENVASGQESADEVVQTWLASPGHCANLMSPDMREMGVAFSFDASSDAGTYWVQVFGARRVNGSPD